MGGNDEAYGFLRKAMRAETEGGFRGPKEFADGKFKYVNNWQGTSENYSGKEKIRGYSGVFERWLEGF